MVRRFAYRCPCCNATTETDTPQKPICRSCNAMMRRDWKAEATTPLYHPTKGR